MSTQVQDYPMTGYVRIRYVERTAVVTISRWADVDLERGALEEVREHFGEDVSLAVERIEEYDDESARFLVSVVPVGTRVTMTVGDQDAVIEVHCLPGRLDRELIERRLLRWSRSEGFGSWQEQELYSRLFVRESAVRDAGDFTPEVFGEGLHQVIWVEARG